MFFFKKISVKKICGPNLATRESAIFLFSQSKEKARKKLFFTFKDVEIVSRSFADQFLAEKEKAEEDGFSVKAFRLSKTAQVMFKLVERQRAKHESAKNSIVPSEPINIRKFKTFDDLFDYLNPVE